MKSLLNSLPGPLQRCASTWRRVWALPAAWLLALGLAPATWAGPTSQCTKANSANGNVNTCWAVFAGNLAPNNFIYAPLNTCNRATTCYNGPNTDPPTKSMLINPSGSPDPRASIPRTFQCDSVNSSGGNPNTCWSVFKDRTPKYLRVTISSAQCKVSTRCWNKDLPADNCKKIDPTGSPNIRPCE